jgi:hypothetical protein
LLCQIGCDLTFVFPPGAGAKERVALIESKAAAAAPAVAADSSDKDKKGAGFELFLRVSLGSWRSG